MHAKHTSYDIKQLAAMRLTFLLCLLRLAATWVLLHLGYCDLPLWGVSLVLTPQRSSRASFDHSLPVLAG